MLRNACLTAACCCLARAGLAQDTTRTDTLTRPPMVMHEVTITATQPMRNEPVSAVRVDPAIIRRTPALNPWDLVRQTAGLEVHDQGQGPGFASDVSIRGFSSDHSTDVALWIDGVPINEPVNGHAEGQADWSLMMPQAVRSIEVIKGPSSALYGNFAMAGVVNVRTLERLQGLDWSLTGGSNGRVEGALLSGFDRNGNSAVFGVRALREDGWRPNSGYQLGQGHARWVRRLTPLSTLDAGLELYAAGWDSPGFLADSLFQRRQYDGVADPTDGGFKRRAQERLSFRTINGSRLWRSTVYATQGRWQLFLTTPPEGGQGEGSGSQTEEEDTRYGFGLTSALTWGFNRAEITVGLEGRWDHAYYQRWFTTARSRDSAETLAGAHQASGALFFQTSADLTPHLRATIGGRYDAVGGNQAVSPKVGLLAHSRIGAAIYANVSRGFRQTDRVIVDPTLPFITEWAYEIGAKLDRGSVSASAALFKMDVSNEQTFNPITLASSSGGASRRKGIELDAIVRLGTHVTLDGSATFTDARYLHLVTEDGDTLDNARVYNTARYVGTAGIKVEHRRYHLRLSGNVVGPYSPFDLPGVVLPAYGLVHLSAGWHFSRTQVDVGIRNLLDRAYPELRAGEFVAPGQPRSVYVMFSARPNEPR